MNFKKAARHNAPRKFVFILIFCLLSANLAFLSLHNLESAGIHNWDEARHGVNAYEMLRTHNYWINTYEYEVDYYNYKPPLSMWIIMLNYTLFGYSPLALRIGSAGCILLMCLLMALFLRKEYGRRASLLFLLFFSFNTGPIFFHMTRSGDADAVYMLFFCAGIICLYYAFKKNTIKYTLMAALGFCFAMAFLAKTVHAALLLIIVLIYTLLKYRFAFKEWRRIIIAGLIGGAPLWIWGLIRYRFDRWSFIGGMFFSEVMGRVINEKKDYFAYLKFYLTDKGVLFMLGLVILTGMLLLCKNWGGAKKSASFNIIVTVKPLLKDTSLFILWFTIPLLVYSISGKLMIWYGYPGLIALTVLFAIITARLLKELANRPVLVGLAGLCLLLGAAFFVNQSRQAFNSISAPDFRLALQTALADYPEYAGADLYIENSANEYTQPSQWEQNTLLEARYVGHFQCRNGGAAAFIQTGTGDTSFPAPLPNPIPAAPLASVQDAGRDASGNSARDAVQDCSVRDAVLIISKDLFAQYANDLTGRIILQDGYNFFVFSSSYYQ